MLWLKGLATLLTSLGFIGLFLAPNMFILMIAVTMFVISFWIDFAFLYHSSKKKKIDSNVRLNSYMIKNIAT